jgi:hypothetical protein
MANGELFRGAATQGGDVLSLRKTARKLFCAKPAVMAGDAWRMRAPIGLFRGINIGRHCSLLRRVLAVHDRHPYDDQRIDHR